MIRNIALKWWSKRDKVLKRNYANATKIYKPLWRLNGQDIEYIYSEIMRTKVTSGYIHTATPFGLTLSTDTSLGISTVYNNGLLIYKRIICGSEDIPTGHVNSFKDFMLKAQRKDLSKPVFIQTSVYPNLPQLENVSTANG